MSWHRFLLLQRFFLYKLTCNYNAHWHKVASVPYLLGRNHRQDVISVGTDTNIWRLGWGFLRFSHSVRVNAAYLKYVTTLCCTPMPVCYSLTIAPSNTTKEGWPSWQIYFLLSGKKIVIYKTSTLLNSKMANSTPYHPPLLREKGLKPKSTFLLKMD